MTKIIALDIAEKMGVVYRTYGRDEFYATTYTGSPVAQMQMLEDVLGEEIQGAIVFYEELNTFVNAGTTRSLLHRAGYLKNSLLRLGATSVEPVNAMSARKFLGFKNKKEVAEWFEKFNINGDEADAMVVMLYALATPIELLTEESIICLRNRL